MPLTTDLIVASTGLWPKKPPTSADVRRASTFLKLWESDIRKFIGGEVSPFEWSTPPNSTALHDMIVQVPTVDQAAEWMTSIGEDPQTGVDYVSAIVRGRDYLLSIWPNLPIEGIIVDSYPLSVDDLGAVWSVVRVLDDPSVMIDEICSRAVTKAQATGFRQVFPDLSVEIDRMIDSAITDHVLGGKSLAWQVVDVIKMWRGIPLTKPLVINKPAEAEKAQTETRSDIDVKDMKLPTERAVIR